MLYDEESTGRLDEPRDAFGDFGERLHGALTICETQIKKK